MIDPEIASIQKSINIHLENLHILLNCDDTLAETEYYNEVTLILLIAKDKIKKASEKDNKRREEFTKNYVNPRPTVY